MPPGCGIWPNVGGNITGDSPEIGGDATASGVARRNDGMPEFVMALVLAANGKLVVMVIARMDGTGAIG